jgi:anti-anti-sigma factor
MAPIESLSVTVSRAAPRSVAERATGGAVVWLRGEHDLSTVAELSEAIAGAILLDDADVVVDLSDVQFMGGATVGVLRRARDLLRARSRCLVLRSPPTCASRVIELCGDADLLAPGDATPTIGAAGALGTWVPVPVTDRADRPANASPPVAVRGPDPVSASTLGAARVSSVVADHRDEQPTAAAAGRGAP